MTFLRIQALVLLLMTVWTGEVVAQGRDLARVEDPVVVSGSALGELLGCDPAGFGLLAWGEGGFVPVPFQVDQRLASGVWAYAAGKKTVRDEDPALDGNDELVSMVADAGDRAPEGLLPAGARAGVELLVRDPVDGGRAWVYLADFDGDPPRSELDYVTFSVDREAGHKYARTRDRRGAGVIVGTPLDSMCPDELRLISTDGTTSPDVLDRLKIRGVMKPKFFFSIDFFLDDIIREKLVAWTDGPVRIMYRGEGYGKLSIVRFPAYEVTEVTYYRNSIEASFRLDLPFRIDTFVKTLPLKGYLDFNEHIFGSRVYSQTNPPREGVMLDGHVSAEEQALDRDKTCSWIVGYGPLGCIINRMFFCDEWADVNKSFYLREDLEEGSKPEDDPGEVAIGFDIRGLEQLDTDKGRFVICFYFLDNAKDFRPGQERPIIDIRDRPLEVSCRAVGELHVGAEEP